MPETAGVSLEEVDALFRSEAAREDADMRQEVRPAFRAFWSFCRIGMLIIVQIMREVGLEALVRELSTGGEDGDGVSDSEVL